MTRQEGKVPISFRKKSNNIQQKGFVIAIPALEKNRYASTGRLRMDGCVECPPSCTVRSEGGILQEDFDGTIPAGLNRERARLVHAPFLGREEACQDERSRNWRFSRMIHLKNHAGPPVHQKRFRLGQHVPDGGRRFPARHQVDPEGLPPQAVRCKGEACRVAPFFRLPTVVCMLDIPEILPDLPCGGCFGLGGFGLVQNRDIKQKGSGGCGHGRRFTWRKSIGLEVEEAQLPGNLHAFGTDGCRGGGIPGWQDGVIRGELGEGEWEDAADLPPERDVEGGTASLHNKRATGCEVVAERGDFLGGEGEGTVPVDVEKLAGA